MSWRANETTVVDDSAVLHPAVRTAAGFLRRDLRSVFGSFRDDGQPGSVIRPVLTGTGPEESWEWVFPDEPGVLEVRGADELGVVYGLLEFSARILGVEPFWFWSDNPPGRREVVSVPRKLVRSEPSRVRFRGWFVNDEVCLLGMSPVYPPTADLWEKVFEALLRLGGNLVIPGTDLPRSGGHWELASAMGLWITNHHAEPLGAEMFSRAFPGVPARYDRESERFEGLWEDAVLRNKDRKVVWVLGFRGQGDEPFWNKDPAYRTPADRGALIAQVIRRQWEILERHVSRPATCSYVYGELTELYRGGHLDLPADTIRVWSDNGYGRMVSRRQNNENSRIPSLPESRDKAPHGLYYHVTFHDLQASNHLTMFPGPADLIRRELEAAFDARADQFLLVNCGNLRPHVLFLEQVAVLWNRGTVNTDRFVDDYCRRVYPSAPEETAAFFRGWARATVAFGSEEDERAGEEFHYQVTRMLLQHWMAHRDGGSAENLHWLTGDLAFSAQVRSVTLRTEAFCGPWADLEDANSVLESRLGPAERTRWRLTIVPQLRLQADGCRGLVSLCHSLELAASRHYARAFVRASKALDSFRQAQEALDEVQVGVWKGFYRWDYLTNVALTVEVVKTFRSVLRHLGDAPDFYLWSRRYLIPVEERGALLENTTRRIWSDDELAPALARVWDELEETP